MTSPRGLYYRAAKLDCFVASLLAMTGLLRSAVVASAAKQSCFLSGERNQVTAARDQRLSCGDRTLRQRLCARTAHSSQQFCCWPGVGRKPVFDLHRLDRAPALLTHDAIDLADIEARAHQQLLQLTKFAEGSCTTGAIGRCIGGAPAIRVAR